MLAIQKHFAFVRRLEEIVNVRCEMPKAARLGGGIAMKKYFRRLL